jgi:Asp/Glu/hydantoin racemase
MTDALKPIIDNLNYSDVHFEYFTAPSTSVTLPDGRRVDGIPSIDSGDQSALSALHCRSFVEPLIPKHDGFLVACYSAHPLVGMLRDSIRTLEENGSLGGNDGTTTLSTTPSSPPRRKYVTGIFEASIATSLTLVSAFQLLDTDSLNKAQAKVSFGIVTTGTVWKPELTKAVNKMLVDKEEDDSDSTRFAGVETTGLTAGQLHETPPEEVRRKMSDATERLLRQSTKPVNAVCLGCAGMVGMEEAVRDGCIKAYGEIQGRKVHIVDGVVAGVGILVNMCKAWF